LGSIDDLARLAVVVESLIPPASGVGIAKHATGIPIKRGPRSDEPVGVRGRRHGAGNNDVIDFGLQDFTRTTQPYDLILDMLANCSVCAYRRALAPGGRYRCVGGSVGTLLRVLSVGPWSGDSQVGRSGCSR
jgi:hypothetical protein